MAKRRKRLAAAPAASAPAQKPPLSGFALHGSALLLIAVVTATLFASTIHFPLVFDDVLFFSPEIFRPATQQSIVAPRWLSTTSFLLPPWAGALPVTAWRITNIGLHALNGAAVYALVWAIARVRLPEEVFVRTRIAIAMGALLAALAFMMHPVSAYAVTYLVQRSTVMATLFSLLALLCVTRWCGNGRPGWLAAALFCVICAVSAKPHALPVVGAMVALVWLLAPSRLHWRGLLAGAVVAGVTTIWVVVPHSAFLFSGGQEPYVRSLGIEGAQTIFLRSALSQCGLFFRYLLVTVFPWTGLMSVDVRVPLREVTGSSIAIAVVFLLTVGASLYMLIRHRTHVAVAGAWALVAYACLFAVELATERIQEPFVLYRNYLWMAPLFVAAGVTAALTRPTRIVWATAAAWLLFAAWGLADRNASFSDPVALWGDAIVKLPAQPVFMSQRPYANRGHALLERGADAEAIADLDRALQIAPAHYEALINRASALARLGDRGRAAVDLERAAALQPHQPYPYAPLCEVYANRGDAVAAERTCTRALSFGATANLHVNRGTVRGMAGNAALALADFEEAVRLDPQSGIALYNRSQALGQLGQAAAAIEGLRNACAMGYALACQAAKP